LNSYYYIFSCIIIMKENINFFFGLYNYIIFFINNIMNNSDKKDIQRLIIPKHLKITVQSPSNKDHIIDKMEKGYVSKTKSYIAIWK